MMPKLIIIALAIYLLYVTYVKIIRINNGEKISILDNVLALVFGCILAIFNWNTMYKDDWYLYFIVLIVICCIVPVYNVIKNILHD